MNRLLLQFGAEDRNASMNRRAGYKKVMTDRLEQLIEENEDAEPSDEKLKRRTEILATLNCGNLSCSTIN